MLPVLNVFISYSRRDLNQVKEVVQRIESLTSTPNLDMNLINVWFDMKSIDTGTLWFEELEKGLNVSDVVCLFLTTESVTSQYVRQEIETAWGRNIVVAPLLCSRISESNLEREQQRFFERVRTIQWIDLTGQTPVLSSGMSRLDELLERMWSTKIDRIMASNVDLAVLGKILHTRHAWAVRYLDKQARKLIRDAEIPSAQYDIYALQSIVTEYSETILSSLADWWRREIPPALTELLEHALRNPVSARFWDDL